MAATLNPTSLNNILHRVSQIANALIGDRASWGVGQLENSILENAPEFGARLAVADLENYCTGLGDLETIAVFAPAVVNLRGATSINTVLANTFSDLFSRINNIIAQMGIGSGVNNLESYLSYHNYGAGGTNLVIQSPAIRRIQEALGVTVNKGNYTFVHGAYWDQFLAMRTFAALTAGTPVDQTKYSGGFGYLFSKVYASTIASGAITVTGTQWNPADQTFSTGKTWVSSGALTGTGIIADLIPGGGSPASTNARLVDISAITGVTAGNTIYAGVAQDASQLFMGGTLWTE
jgi:hypothetical protein